MFTETKPVVNKKFVLYGKKSHKCTNVIAFLIFLIVQVRQRLACSWCIDPFHLLCTVEWLWLPSICPQTLQYLCLSYIIIFVIVAITARAASLRSFTLIPSKPVATEVDILSIHFLTKLVIVHGTGRWVFFWTSLSTHCVTTSVLSLASPVLWIVMYLLDTLAKYLFKPFAISLVSVTISSLIWIIFEAGTVLLGHRPFIYLYKTAGLLLLDAMTSI